MKILKKVILFICVTSIFYACDKEDIGDSIDTGLMAAALQSGKWYYEDIGDTPDEDWNCIHYAWYQFNSDNTLSTGSVNDENNCDDIEVANNDGIWESVSTTKVKITYNNGYIEEFDNLEFLENQRMSADISLGNNIYKIVFDKVAGAE